MIIRNTVAQWQNYAPWQTFMMVEQDLIISRALIELYKQPKVQTSLAFRGGTALNKLYIQPPARYSEDIDLVQIVAEPIGDSINAIRSALDNWLGEPKRKLTERSAKLIYRYTSIDNISNKLKIEINTTEHFNVEPLKLMEFNVISDWYSGKANILTYDLNELMATKLRALYQRRKSRDLFDLWYVLDKNLINVDKVVSIFNHYCQHNQEPITRAMFEQNLHLKEINPLFISDISVLLSSQHNWNLKKALNHVKEAIVPKLKGETWKLAKSNASPKNPSLISQNQV